MNHTPPRVAPEDKVPVAQKLGYGLGTFHDMWGHWLYPSMAYQVFNIYLGVSPALIARALFLNRIFDAVSDPFFGWASDNTRTRFGRRRPFILVGSTLAGVALPLLFFVRPGWSEMGYFWFMLGSSAVFIPLMSCFYMPYQSLGAELTPDYHERTSVFSFRYAIQKIPEAAMMFAAQFTTLAVWVGATNANVAGRVERLFTTPSAWKAAVAEKPNILLGAQVYCAILGALMILAGIGVFALVRERYYGKLARKQEKVSITETLYRALRCKPFRRQLLMVLAFQMGTSMVGTLGYYDTVYYVCRGDVALGASWNTGMGIASMALGLLGIPAYGFIAHRFGKIRAMISVLATAVAVYAGTWWLYDPDFPVLQLLASGFIAFINGGFNTLEGSIGADVMDYDELSSGKRREGAFSACKSWIMKLGMALGTLASGEILARTGFDARLGPSQTPHALFMIRLLLAVVPIGGLLCALLAVMGLSLTEGTMRQIRQELETRRGTV
jgi:glycoside/pentoside/hexuronide:cation symporter, GPH family